MESRAAMSLATRITRCRVNARTHSGPALYRNDNMEIIPKIRKRRRGEYHRLFVKGAYFLCKSDCVCKARTAGFAPKVQVLHHFCAKSDF